MNTAFIQFIVRDLTPPMLAALRERQTDMFGRDMLASGHPQTIKALRRRGLVEDPPHAITEFGELVCGAVDQRQVGEGADA